MILLPFGQKGLVDSRGVKSKESSKFVTKHVFPLMEEVFCIHVAVKRNKSVDRETMGSCDIATLFGR